jgi:hypothetical protein
MENLRAQLILLISDPGTRIASMQRTPICGMLGIHEKQTAMAMG